MSDFLDGALGLLGSGLSVYGNMQTADEQQAIAEAQAAAAASAAEAEKAKASTSLAAYATANPGTVALGVLAVAGTVVLVTRK